MISVDMDKVGFIFIALLLVCLPLNPVLNSSLEVLVCSAAILTFGVAHGAADHLIYQNGTFPTNLFIRNYLVAIIAFAGSWYFLPGIALIFFLLISAFHFGESQFVDLGNDRSFLFKGLHLIWGIFLINALIGLNYQEIVGSISADLLSQLWVFEFLADFFEIIFIISLGITLGIFIILIKSGDLSFHRLVFELYVLLLLVLTFKVFSLLLGFTIYFISLHSIRVMMHVFNELEVETASNQTVSFIKKLTPLTIASNLGLMGIYFILQYFEIEFSLVYVLLILVSAITLPHSVVMNNFYSWSLHKTQQT